MLFAKVGVLGAWIFCLGNLFFSYPGAWGTTAFWALGILIVSHIAETMFVLKKIKASPDPFLPNLIASFIFGHAHNHRYFKS